MPIERVVSGPGRFRPLDIDHPAVGRICPGCGEPMKVGQAPALVNGLPADAEEAQKAAARRAHTLVCVVAHESCAARVYVPDSPDD